MIVVSADTLALLNDRASQIAVGELLAVILLLFCFSSELSGKSLVAFIDNLGVLFAIVKGTSRSEDLGSMVHSLHWQCQNLSAQP